MFDQLRDIWYSHDCMYGARVTNALAGALQATVLRSKFTFLLEIVSSFIKRSDNSQVNFDMY